MSDYHELLQWAANRANARLLEVAQSPREGYKEIVMHDDSTFYGMVRPYQHGGEGWQYLENANYTQAKQAGDITKDYPEFLFERSHKIGVDLGNRSLTENFEFYNGTLARLKDADVTVTRGKVQTLHLTIGKTSYFTAVGSNLHFGGYTIRKTDESIPPLSRQYAWTDLDDWRDAIRESPLSNHIAVDLFLYNSSEILYVRRGNVGKQSSLWNTPVNGAMEFDPLHPDTINGEQDGQPDISVTAIREAKAELNVDVDPTNIKWIGLCATRDFCEPFIVGVYRIPDSRSALRESARGAPEGPEVADDMKNFQAIPPKQVERIRYRSKIESINIGELLFPLITDITVGLPRRLLKRVIQQKIIERTEIHNLRSIGKWTSEGATSLLLCLAHLVPEATMVSILSEIKSEVETQTTFD